MEPEMPAQEPSREEVVLDVKRVVVFIVVVLVIVSLVLLFVLSPPSHGPAVEEGAEPVPELPACMCDAEPEVCDPGCYCDPLCGTGP